MRAGRDYQPLSYDLCLPNFAQADALRLLDASRAVVNAALVQFRLAVSLRDATSLAAVQLGAVRGRFTRGVD